MRGEIERNESTNSKQNNRDAELYEPGLAHCLMQDHLCDCCRDGNLSIQHSEVMPLWSVVG